MPPKFRTRFPVARIKKIMQVDEEIGKVSQATPILISKAIELFLNHLIGEIVDETSKSSASQVTPNLLKRIVNEKEQFDFLRHLLEKIPDNDQISSPKKS